jgi:hypothetical protein
VAYGDYEDPNRPDYYDPYAPVPPPEPSGPVTPPPPPPAAPTPPPATPPATDPPGVQGGKLVDPRVYFMHLVETKNLGPTFTPEGLRSLMPDLAKYGITLQIDSSNKVRGRLFLPGGESVDVTPSGGGAWAWINRGAGGGGDNASGSGVDLSQVSIDPSYLERFEGAAPNFREQPNFMAPGAFTGLSESELYADPSYKFRVGQGAGAIENSAAARGVLNSGGTLYDILNFGQKAGSQEYGAQWDRKFNTWNADWNNAMSRFSADKSAVDTGNQNLWMRYLDAQNLHFRNQSEPFSKLIQAANLGVGAAR